MSKKTNTILFILGGTVFSIVITVLCFLFFLFMYSRFLFPRFPGSSAAWVIPINFAASIAASLLVYRQAIKIIVKKVDMEKYFDPVFTQRRNTAPCQPPAEN
ncbi:MAG: leader peptide processing enzyme [Treponema sp.]|nr:leader peptide processing enzyme [Treponema sp.]